MIEDGEKTIVSMLDLDLCFGRKVGRNRSRLPSSLKRERAKFKSSRKLQPIRKERLELVLRSKLTPKNAIQELKTQEIHDPYTVGA
jgi:hypothetical protein